MMHNMELLKIQLNTLAGELSKLKLSHQRLKTKVNSISIWSLFKTNLYKIGKLLSFNGRI